MWLMLQHQEPLDLVIATGKQYSVRFFAELAASQLGFEIEWHGQGVNEKGLDRKTGKTLIAIDPKYFRPTEVESLLGDPSKAKQILGWEPRITFEKLVAEMCESDLIWAKGLR
jgi:GDPmannose 4,6-dehydratase